MARIPGLLPMVWPPYFPHAYHRQLGPENRPPYAWARIHSGGRRTKPPRQGAPGRHLQHESRANRGLEKTAADQLPDLLMALGLNLTAEEVAHLDEASAKVG